MAQVDPDLVASPLSCGFHSINSSVASRVSGDGCFCRGRAVSSQHTHGRHYTTSLVRHLREPQRHLDAGERAHQHQVIEMTEMTDAENLALDLAETRPQRHVEVIERHLAE